MKRTECRFQALLTPEDVAGALEAARCYRCSLTAAELLQEGKLLEVCGEEHICDLTGAQDYSVAIALCPDCHAQAHLDADRRHVPCHVQARRSREWIDWPSRPSAGKARINSADILG